MPITSSVRLHGGVPTLFINDSPIPGVAYMTYLPERACYGDFSIAGYRLFSLSCFFGTCGINEMSGIYPFADGLFEDPDTPNFAPLDEGVARILSACPEALIFPRVNVSLPTRWERAHPEACNNVGVNGRPPRGCFGSEAWRKEAKRCLSLLVAHIEAAPWRDHVIGYQISGGQTEEWFPFDFAGGVGKATREGFASRAPEAVTENRDPAWRRYLNDTVADTISLLCTHVKELTDHRLVVGSFYGYTFETPWWWSGHHSLLRLLASPDIDFLSSPVSYAGLRAPGRDFPAMTVADTITRHGKLYFAECDIRTHLTRPLPACRPNACPPGTYEDPVWQPQGNENTARGVLRAVFARQLTHGHALWWFDMFGGWYQSPGIMADMRRFAEIATEDLNSPRRGSAAELAVVAEDEQFLQVEGGARCVCRDFFGLCGAPFDTFELADMPYVCEHHRAVVFVAPHLSEKMGAAMQMCDARGIPYLVQDEAHIPSPDELRALCLCGGAHLYTDSADPVYVSPSCIALHAATPGLKTLHLKGSCRVTDLLGEIPPTVTDTIVFQAEMYNTYLFRLEPISHL